MFLLHENVFPQRLRRLNTTSWALGPVPWITEPFGEIGIAPASRLSLSAATVGTGRTFTSAATEVPARSEEHTSELQSLMRISYAVFCLKKKNKYISSYK